MSSSSLLSAISDVLFLHLSPSDRQWMLLLAEALFILPEHQPLTRFLFGTRRDFEESLAFGGCNC